MARQRLQGVGALTEISLVVVNGIMTAFSTCLMLRSCEGLSPQELLISAKAIWSKKIQSGELRDSILILSRHLEGILPMSMVAALTLLPQNVNLADLNFWFERVSLPSSQDDVTCIVKALTKRALQSELDQKSPLNAVLFTSLAIRILVSVKFFSDDVFELQKDTEELLRSLQLLNDVYIQWGRRISLAAYKQIGFRGLVVSYLNEVPVEAMAANIVSKLRPLVVQTKEASLDELLSEWIRHIIASTVFSMDDSKEEEEGISGEEKLSNDLFSKLVIW